MTPTPRHDKSHRLAAVTVRPANEADHAAIVRMFRNAFSDDVSDASPDWQEIESRALFETDKIARSSGALLLVEDRDRRILGMVTLRPGLPPDCEPGETIATRGTGPGVATVESLWVEPTHRRRGHAERLLMSALALARSQGLGTLCIAYEDANIAAAALYHRMGFCRVRA